VSAVLESNAEAGPPHHRRAVNCELPEHEMGSPVTGSVPFHVHDTDPDIDGAAGKILKLPPPYVVPPSSLSPK